MDRDFRFPCTEHVWPAMEEKKSRLKDRPCKEQALTRKECEAGYHPECEECRESYKHYSRAILFTDKFWNFRFRLTRPTYRFYKYVFEKNWKYGMKHLWLGLTCRYSNPEFAHAYWYTWFGIFEFSWREYEFYDIYRSEDEVIDIDKLKEYHYTNPEYETTRQHQVKVLRRYYKMFRKRT